MTHAMVQLGLPLLVLPATGCTTMGTGFGSTAAGTGECQMPSGKTIDATFPRAI